LVCISVLISSNSATATSLIFSQLIFSLDSSLSSSTTSVDNSIHITVLLEDTHHSYEPVDELPPYSEEVIHQTPPATHDTPSWIIGFDQQDILVSQNNSKEELESDSDHALDINLEDFFYTAPIYSLLLPLVQLPVQPFIQHFVPPPT
ncbi:558_t:CDS:2, partial [Cetraspora pellucida]